MRKYWQAGMESIGLVMFYAVVYSPGSRPSRSVSKVFQFKIHQLTNGCDGTQKNPSNEESFGLAYVIVNVR